MMQHIKLLVQRILGPAYLSLAKRLNFFYRKFKGGYFGLNDLDKRLEKYINYDNGFYVELGANDGVSQSNTLYYELKRGWKGVLIEPSPHNYLSCKEYRGDRNFIFCNACVGFDYTEKYVDIKYANLMTVSENLNLDLEDVGGHIESGKQFLRESEGVFEFGSVAATLTELLERSDAPELIDLLSLDVEGAELNVLNGIDFDRFNFKFMIIEIRDFDRIAHFLKKYNYKYVDKLSEHDYLFEYCKP